MALHGQREWRDQSNLKISVKFQSTLKASFPIFPFPTTAENSLSLLYKEISKSSEIKL